MSIVEFIIVVLLALFVASIFFYGFRSRGPWGVFWVLLLFLILAGVVARLWITPTGPLIWGFAWIPVLFFVLIVALLIAAANPTERDRRRSRSLEAQAESQPTDPRREAGAAFGIFFWLLLILFFTAIVVGIFTA